MTTQYDYFAIVIGAGAGGLAIAKGLAKAGKKVLLVEKSAYSENVALGSIASKALITCSNIAHELWRSALYGLDMRIGHFQTSRVFGRIREIGNEIKKQNHPDVLRTLGIDYSSSVASFVDPHTIQVNGNNANKRQVSGKHIVIATGSLPRIPSIRGLSDVQYRTDQTIFSLNEIPTSIAIIGAGQIGCELAQSFRRLGSRVILIEQSDFLLTNEEPEAYKVVLSALIKEGVEIYLASQVTRVRKDGDRINLHIKQKTADMEYDLHAHEIIFATGKKPNIEDLNLLAAEIEHTQDAIAHDLYGRTTNGHIWVVGDVAGLNCYSHAAVDQAKIVLHNMLSRGLFYKKIQERSKIPRVIFTDPEVSSIGLTEQEAIEKYSVKNIRTYMVPLSECDRAICDDRTDGFVKFVTKGLSCKILGATIVGPCASEMLVEISCAMRDGVSLRKLSTLIHPYPTYSQIIQKAADMCVSDTTWPFYIRVFGKFFW